MIELQSERHQKALLYAIDEIKKSPLYPYLDELYLYGSCARNENKWRSDIDLFMELNVDATKVQHWKKEIILLRSMVSSDKQYDVECDLKIVLGSEWKNSDMLYYQNVKKEGIRLWI